MKIINVFVVSILIFSACSVQKPAQDEVVSQAFDFAGSQIRYALTGIEEAEGSTDPKKISPRSVRADGSIEMVSIGDWTCGFFPGELWYMYEYTSDPEWKLAAEKFTDKLEPVQYYKGDHDIGFRVYCSYGNGLRLTGNEKYKEIMMQSARSLMTRYNPQMGLIRSWDFNKDKWQYPVIIDNMMNLELLFWACKESGDSAFYQAAVSHADKTLTNHFRADNSSYHVVVYDTITGSAYLKCTHQGYADESAWARGQAWGAYGFTVCYRETQNPAYLKKAEGIISFIFNNPHLPTDLIPYWDYNAPNIPDEPKDVSAASIVASALYELCQYLPDRAEQYKKWADTILESLNKNYRATAGGDGGFVLSHSVGDKRTDSEVDVPLVYADYYFLEALLRKQQMEENPLPKR
ncbi:MAG: glycoside hydrolase family 88 protein [Dysgonamonadaceae bacterium]|jgi:hypothetical protein|nr:glycoside hydrolase family 88 protein [Dysgonamonadaceae bacterium]